MSTAKVLSDAGIFAGAEGLEMFANDNEFCANQPYGTRFYFNDNLNVYLHRDVLRVAIKLLAQMDVDTENARLSARVAELEKKLVKTQDWLAMVEQESDRRLSAIIGYSDQLLAMKEKYEPEPIIAAERGEGV